MANDIASLGFAIDRSQAIAGAAALDKMPITPAASRCRGPAAKAAQ